jgi:hypothetical protein
MTDALEGINEKLARANENILNLEAEITRFLQESKHPIIGNEYHNLLIKKAEYNFARKIPIRFSVLAGEIVNQFRSSLDHIAWALAIPDERSDHPTSIEFPVFCEKSKAARCEDKIKLIASAEARSLIKSVQPYLGADPLDTPLWVMHDLDRICKHRALPLTFTLFDLGSSQLNAIANLYASNPSLPMSPELARKLNEQMNLTPVIAFREFVKGQPYPVIRGLTSFEVETRRIVGLFEGELLKC